MIFYGNGAVWHSERNKIVARFENGKFETDDKDIIEHLISNNYKHDEVIEDAVWEKETEEEKVNSEEMTNNELRSTLEEKGHTGLDRKNKKQLLELIEGD